MDKHIQIIDFKQLRLKSQLFDLTINIMKSKLITFYQILLSTYFYSIKYDEEKSRRYAYYAIRNLIEVLIFMFSLVIFVVITCLYNITIDLKGNRLAGYFFMIVVGFSYISLTKKYLRPIFNGIELKKEKASKFFFIGLLIIVGLFGAAVYAIPRILNIYLCG